MPNKQDEEVFIYVVDVTHPYFVSPTYHFGPYKNKSEAEEDLLRCGWTGIVTKTRTKEETSWKLTLENRKFTGTLVKPRLIRREDLFSRPR